MLEEELTLRIIDYAKELIKTIQVCSCRQKVKEYYIYRFHKKVAVFCLLDIQTARAILNELLVQNNLNEFLKPYLELLYICIGEKEKENLSNIMSTFQAQQNDLGFNLLNKIKEKQRLQSYELT